MPAEALDLIGQRSLDLFRDNNLDRPYTWIQPGGQWPLISSEAAMSSFGNNLGYTAAGTYVNSSLKCYNEYDPANNMRFGMDWGDFYDDDWDAKHIKEFVADRVARHYVVVGHSHFGGLLGGVDVYLQRIDSILSWCKKNQSRIFVLTYQDAAKLLHDTPQDPYVNIMPLLDVDLDGNGFPDGYLKQFGYTDGTWDTTDGVAQSTYHSFKLNKRGSICYVSDLAGIEKGENDFEIWTKGSAGNSIEVAFSFAGMSPQVFRFPALDTVWRRYSLAQSTNANASLVIPTNVSTMNVQISCVNYVGGTVGVSGMNLHKKASQILKIISLPDTLTFVQSTYRYKINAISQDVADTLSFTMLKGPAWLTIDRSGTLTGVPSSVDTGVFQVQLKVADQHQNNDFQAFQLVVTSRYRSPLVILSIPDTIAFPGGSYNYYLYTNGSKDDTLTYGLLGAPPWLSVDKTGIVRGTVPSETSRVRVSILVKDQVGKEATQVYDLSVGPHVVDDFAWSDSPFDHGWVIEEGQGVILAKYDSVKKERILSVSTILGTAFRVDHAGTWSAKSFSLVLQASSGFVLYVRGKDANDGDVTLQYAPDSGPPTKNGTYAILHIGATYSNGKWNVIARDLDGDLKSVGWGSSMKIITSFMFRGSFNLSDFLVGYPVATSDVSNPAIAHEFRLQQNYPNPFNPSTTIKYSIMYPSRVQLEIYNVLGQLIKTLAGGDFQPNGFYSVQWNGEDSRGVKMSSGVYFCRLLASPLAGGPPFVATSKMLLLK
jgi:hypothetical protein